MTENSEKALEPSALYRVCPPGQFGFETTDELADLNEVIGQARALDAVRLGIGVRNGGYNLYVLGPAGTGKYSAVRQFLEEAASTAAVPSDWCYVNNFRDATKPCGIRLPAGRGVLLSNDMRQLVEELRHAIPAMFESEEYQARSQKIQSDLKEREDEVFNDLHREAERNSFKLLRTPNGFMFTPTRNGEVISPDDFDKLPDKEQARFEAVGEHLQEKLKEVFRTVSRLHEENRAKLKELNNEFTIYAVGHLIDRLKARYADVPEVIGYLEEVQRDVVVNVDTFLRREQSDLLLALQERGPSHQRYQVNIVVDNANTTGAPVVYEDNPTYANLVGRVEHIAQLGALVTNFTLVKAGALHRANGGYLILDVRKLLMQPYAWDGLKRALYAREVRIESLGQALSLISTVSLEPASIPLDVKVVLLGDRLLYYLLYQYDPDFGELFKVAADFEDSLDRSTDNDLLYARLIGTLARRAKLLPLDRGAVARIIEHSMRLAGDTQKLSMHVRSVADLLTESSYWAGAGDRACITAADVQQTINSQIRRADRLRDRLHEAIRRDTVMIATDGSVVGQINGLTVIDLGNISFGVPVRITANTRLGEGEVLDIERETELGGPIHSKGVFILASFLGSRYSRDMPLSLAASLTFEQSYGGVEGDSASLAELCALLSSLGNLPVKQALAVTGSVNQHGQVQAIGGVNEKIEGFFDVCRARGLTGEQGVLIPASNVQHLMLRQDVVTACGEGRFHVWEVKTVDEALAVVIGMDAGQPAADGGYPENTINGIIQARVNELTGIREAFAANIAGGRVKAKRKP